MQMVPFQELTDAQWQQAYDLAFDREVLDASGPFADITIEAKIPLQEYYNKVMDEIESNALLSLAAVRNGEVVGSGQLLLSPHGEWELGVTLLKGARGVGYGPRIAMALIQHAFEHGIPWIVAFSYGEDERVRDMLKKLGFEPLMNFWVLRNPNPTPTGE